MDIVQPALFAVMVSLAKLWQECGVEPAAVLGHSQGEIAAAHIAGALSLEDAAMIVARRAKAMAKIAGKGAMAIGLAAGRGAEALLEPYGSRISLAAINGPASLVLSGDPKALDRAAQHSCEAEGVSAPEVAVDYAAHSAQIEALEKELLEAFAPISPQSSQIPFHSTVTASQIDTKELDAAYWYRNLRETVRFEPVIRELLKGGPRAFIELGPHPVLALRPCEETIDDALPNTEKATVLSTLRREEGGPRRFALSLAQAHANGVEVNWPTFFKGTGAKAVPLPTYPFQRKRYWLEASTQHRGCRLDGADGPRAPPLGGSDRGPRGRGAHPQRPPLPHNPPLARRPRGRRHASFSPAPPSWSWP